MEASEFSLCPSRHDGLSARCRPCTREYQREYWSKLPKETRVAKTRAGREQKLSATHKRCRRCSRLVRRESFFVDKRRSDGLGGWCKPCFNDAHRESYRLPERRQAKAEQGKAARRALREEVLAHYGGVCVCCGERRYEFLSIDHTRGDGNKHRREMPRAKKLASWLKSNGYPAEGFRVLCHNCNMARGLYGHCPHERERGMPANDATQQPA